MNIEDIRNINVKQFDFIISRIDSHLFSEYLSFYREYFSNDEEFLNFVYNALENEPEKEIVLNKGLVENQSIQEEVFIPRRMMNIVMRMVSFARDTDIIRKDKDTYKIVFLITCVESLQLLNMYGYNTEKKASKWDLIKGFFDKYTSGPDKQYIEKTFCLTNPKCYLGKLNNFELFIKALNEFRNSAIHEGEFYGQCFNNQPDCESVIVFKKIKKGKKGPAFECYFDSMLSYQDFERIHVRSCISCIKDYVICKP